MSSGLSLTDPALLAALERQRRLVTTLAGSDRFESSTIPGLVFVVADLLS